MSVVAVAAVQNRFSPLFLDNTPQLDRCTQLGTAFLPWAPFEGFQRVDELGPVGQRFKSLANELQVSVYRLAVAWALAQSPNVVPIPGATRPQSILDDVAALSLSLTPDQVTWLDGTAAAR
jgi:aryl-alcohol dehydrogenase-like predicted oxidoreductase